MKKSLLAMAALGAILFTACSSDEMVAPGAGDGSVTFTFVPEAAMSRAYADGLSATTLHYAAYEAGTKTVVYTSANASDPQAAAAGARNFTLTLDLVKGKAYDFVFWADKGTGSPYTFDADAQTVTVDYATPTGNDEGRDAFFQTVKSLQVNGPAEQTVTLRRPFAQVNIGTSDLEAAAKLNTTIASTALKVSGVYTTLDLFTGLASGPVDVTFTATGLPEGETFPTVKEGVTYDYLTMDYLLTGTELEADDVQAAKSELMNCELTLGYEGGTEQVIKLDNVPVQRNYRTNIFGALLTSPLDFTITVDQEFNTPDHNVNVEGVEIDETAKEILISNPNGLKWMSTQVNSNKDNFRGYTVKLANDIDMAGVDFTPIGNSITSYPSYAFAGTFDGQGHTISNLTASSNVPNWAAAGLFGAIVGNVKNLTMKNPVITSTHYAGGIVGYVDNNNGAVIEGCKVIGGSITSTAESVGGGWDNGDKAGGILGYGCNYSDKVTNCSVEGVTITCYRHGGSIVGYAGNTANVTGNTATDVTIIWDSAHDYKGFGTLDKVPLGPIAGNSADIFGDNTATGISISQGASAATSDELNALVAAATPGQPLTITLAVGTFSTKDMNFAQNADITFKGAGAAETVIAAEPYKAAHGCNLVFEDLTVETTKMAGTEMGFQHTANCTFNRVTFKGEYFTYASGADIFNDCTFVNNTVNGYNKYSVWCYGGRKAVFNDCKFTNNVGKAILVYNVLDNLGNYDITVNNCTFTVSGLLTDKAVVEIHTELWAATGGTVKINGCTYDPAKFKGGLWNELNNSTDTPTDFFTIIVDGETVQTGTH